MVINLVFLHFRLVLVVQVLLSFQVLLLVPLIPVGLMHLVDLAVLVLHPVRAVQDFQRDLLDRFLHVVRALLLIPGVLAVLVVLEVLKILADRMDLVVLVVQFLL